MKVIPKYNTGAHSTLPEFQDAESVPFSSCHLSVIVPIYNERDSIPLLLENISQVLKEEHVDYEIICVDDGSTDGSTDFLIEQSKFLRTDLKAVILRRNYGQTAAMSAGFKKRSGSSHYYFRWRSTKRPY
jgi:glycosyltransferase involved in cell wall biosynthesis